MSCCVSSLRSSIRFGRCQLPKDPGAYGTDRQPAGARQRSALSACHWHAATARAERTPRHFFDSRLRPVPLRSRRSDAVFALPGWLNAKCNIRCEKYTKMNVCVYPKSSHLRYDHYMERIVRRRDPSAAQRGCVNRIRVLRFLTDPPAAKRRRQHVDLAGY